MTNDDNKVLMQSLLDGVKSAVAAVNVLQNKVETMAVEMGKTNVAVARMEVELKHRSCPAPGTCNTLAEQVGRMDARINVMEDAIRRIAHMEGLEERIKPLEEKFQQLAGARWATGLIFTVGTAAGGVVVWVLQTFALKG